MTCARKSLVCLNDTPYYWWKTCSCASTISAIHGGHTSLLAVSAAHGCGVTTNTQAKTIHIARHGCSSVLRSSHRSLQSICARTPSCRITTTWSCMSINSGRSLGRIGKWSIDGVRCSQSRRSLIDGSKDFAAMPNARLRKGSWSWGAADFVRSAGTCVV
jgi:hypothetical protein